VGEAELVASEVTVIPGQDVVISPPADGSLGMGGSLSRFERWTGDE
jgi:hypothetical protein